jgi:formylglycine-generating enzyme required for sulfatase activity
MLKITLTLETGGFAMNCRHVIVCLSAITIAMLVSVSCRNQPQVDLDWIDIAGGSFEMGNPDDSSNDPYEQNYLETEVPVHEVTVPDFKMLKSEVTVEQYKA